MNFSTVWSVFIYFKYIIAQTGDMGCHLEVRSQADNLKELWSVDPTAVCVLTSAEEAAQISS